MAILPEIDLDKAAADAEKALSTPLGFASPLWAAYAGVTGAGIAYWWLSQWTKPVNLEALTDMMGKYSLIPVPELAPAEVPMLAAETAVAAVETVAETVEALTPEPAIPEPALVAAAVEPEIQAAEAVVMAAPAMAEATADDLTRLVGIGPTLAAKLNDLGVTTYSDIAAWTPVDVERFDKTLTLLGRATRDNWIGQAKQLADATAD